MFTKEKERRKEGIRKDMFNIQHAKNEKKEHCYASATTASSMDGDCLETMQEPSRGHSHCWLLGTSFMTIVISNMKEKKV